MESENSSTVVLLNLVSKASAIITELQRLSEYIPGAFWDNVPEEAKHFRKVILDYSYFQRPEEYDSNIYSDNELQELDENFRESNIQILERLYKLFEAIYKYHRDLQYFLKKLSEGGYMQQSPETMMQQPEGKKLLCESIYLMGTMLLLMDFKIPGTVRERILVSYYRYKGNAIIEHINDVCTLCRRTGFSWDNLQGKPANYPEDYFMRCPIPVDIVSMILGFLKDDDLYNQIGVYPSPDHRPTALSSQAAVMMILLFYLPDYLKTESNKMRELIDKFFPDNWVVPFYLGYALDLSLWWVPYEAAHSALEGFTLNNENLSKNIKKHLESIKMLNKGLNHYLKEGILTEPYILAHSSKLMHHMRECNVSLRWIMLHRTTVHPKVNEFLQKKIEMQSLLRLLMNTAQFERNFKQKIEGMLDKKEEIWEEDRKQACSLMRELSDYFSGERPLARGIEKDERLRDWFSQIERTITSLDINDQVSSTKRISQLTQALEEVENYHQIEGNLQIKQFLIETRDYLKHMMNIVNLQNDILTRIARISDFSYAWLCMGDFLELMQEAIRNNPTHVRLLESAILKLSSILHVPLIRILESNSPDLESVSQYYSNELVKYVRKALQVIPQSVFKLLDEISNMRSCFQEIPRKIKREEVKELSNLEERHALAAYTHQISVFTQGILIMERTFVGLIEVDPKKLLEDGIRRELVNKISDILHTNLSFKDCSLQEFYNRLDSLASKLNSFKQAFEYIQDFIGLYGLKIWQEEMTRVVGYNIDLEASTFLPLQKSLDLYQSADIPIPKPLPQDSLSLTFMGRLLIEVLKQCDITKNSYIEWMHGWYDSTGREVIGLEVMNKLDNSIGILGLAGLDKLLSCTVFRNLKQFINVYKKKIPEGKLNGLWNELQPLSQVPDKGRSVYSAVFPFIKEVHTELHPILIRIGQMQLLRRLISYQINFRARIDSPLLWSALSTVNNSTLSDLETRKDLPPEEDEFIPSLESFLDQTGFVSPFEKVYIPPGQELDKFPMVMALLTIYQMSNQPTDKKKQPKECRDLNLFTAGLLSTFKQFHSKFMSCYLAYLGQFVSTCLLFLGEKKLFEMPIELKNVLKFIEELRKLAGLPRQYVENFLPTYILDKVTINA